MLVLTIQENHLTGKIVVSPLHGETETNKRNETSDEKDYTNMGKEKRKFITNVQYMEKSRKMKVGWI